MMVLLRDMGKKECGEGDCEVETARNIGADYVISGKVVRIEQIYAVTLKLHETQGGSLLGTDTVEGSSQIDLLRSLREHSRMLVTAAFGQAPGRADRDRGARATGPAREKQMISLHRNSDGLLAGRSRGGGWAHGPSSCFLSQGSPARAAPSSGLHALCPKRKRMNTPCLRRARTAYWMPAVDTAQWLSSWQRSPAFP